MALKFAKEKPKWAAGSGAALLLVGFLALRSATAASDPDNSLHKVKRGDFLISIVEGGTLKAVREVTVRSELEGSAQILSIVPEGTYVKKGDLLVELDSAELRDRITAQEVVVQNSQFAFVQSKENLAISKSLVDSNIRDAELKLEFARSDLSKYIEGDFPQSTNNIVNKKTLAEEELKRADERRNWTIELEKKGYATKTELEADDLAVRRKQIEVKSAEEDLRLLLTYDYPKRLRLLQSNVEQAQAELDRVKARGAAQLAQGEADLAARQSTLDLNEKRLAHQKQQLELTKIHAPQDGLVIYASSNDSRGGGALIEEGTVVRQRQDLIKLPDVSNMLLEVRVNESHVQQVKPGLRTFVSIDSVPDRQFRGVVRRVAILPDSASRYFNPNLKVYVTEVLIEDKLPDLKPGISGRAEIIVTNLTGVVSVPIQAVTSVKGKQVCFVQNGKTANPVPVEVGMYNDKFIEVRNGLKEGDTILLSTISKTDGLDLGGSVLNGSEEDLNAAPQPVAEAPQQVGGFDPAASGRAERPPGGGGSSDPTRAKKSKRPVTEASAPTEGAN